MILLIWPVERCQEPAFDQEQVAKDKAIGLAEIFTRHDSKLRSLRSAKAESRESRERLESRAAISNVHEAQWDPAEHPKGAYPQNRGWWSLTTGSGNAERPPSFLDPLVRRNAILAGLTSVVTPSTIGSSRLAVPSPTSLAKPKPATAGFPAAAAFCAIRRRGRRLPFRRCARPARGCNGTWPIA
jgi:hypothetical protein